MADLLSDCSHANDSAHLPKEAGASLRLLARESLGRKVEVSGGSSRRRTERGHLHPPVFNAFRQQLLFGGVGLGRVSEAQRAEELEADLGVAVIRQLHKLLDKFWMARQVGFSQANSVLAHPCLWIIKRLPQQVLIKLSQAVQRPQSVDASEW